MPKRPSKHSNSYQITKVSMTIELFLKYKYKVKYFSFILTLFDILFAEHIYSNMIKYTFA